MMTFVLTFVLVIVTSSRTMSLLFGALMTNLSDVTKTHSPSLSNSENGTLFPPLRPYVIFKFTVLNNSEKKYHNSVHVSPVLDCYFM